MLQFKIYNPEIRQERRSGGYTFFCEVTESEWEQIKDINSPKNHNKSFVLVLLSEEESKGAGLSTVSED